METRLCKDNPGRALQKQRVAINSLVEALVLIDECRAGEQLVRQVEDLSQKYGFDYYALVLNSRSGGDPVERVLACRWPDRWLDIYASRKYGLIDPVKRYLMQAQRAFRWRDALFAYRNDPHRKRMDRMMVEAGNFGLADGYVFPVHGRCGLMGHVLVGGKALDLSPAEIALFDAVAKKAVWRFLELHGQACELEWVPTPEVHLTRREMEVLNFLAGGMTSNEISKIIQISNHTVDWYMNGIQDKLGARNRQHAVAIAFRQGLIS